VGGGGAGFFCHFGGALGGAGFHQEKTQYSSKGGPKTARRGRGKHLPPKGGDVFFHPLPPKGGFFGGWDRIGTREGGFFVPASGGGGRLRVKEGFFARAGAPGTKIVALGGPDDKSHFRGGGIGFLLWRKL